MAQLKGLQSRFVESGECVKKLAGKKVILTEKAVLLTIFNLELSRQSVVGNDMTKNIIRTDFFNLNSECISPLRCPFTSSIYQEGKEILVPLTSSMYVPGRLSDVENVMVDIGTGYQVKMVSKHTSNSPKFR